MPGKTKSGVTWYGPYDSGLFMDEEPRVEVMADKVFLILI